MFVLWMSNVCTRRHYTTFGGVGSIRKSTHLDTH
jgi:hypothetical protein